MIIHPLSHINSVDIFLFRTDILIKPHLYNIYFLGDNMINPINLIKIDEIADTSEKIFHIDA